MKIDTSVSGLQELSARGGAKPSKGSEVDDSFSELLNRGMDKLNGTLNLADEQAQALAAGKDIDVPDAMIAITKADISFKMFLQLRNRAISAYEEIMRLQF